MPEPRLHSGKRESKLSLLDSQIKVLFTNVERHVMPLIENDRQNNLSKQENKVLALQDINRFNIYLGKKARSTKDESGNLHILQIYVNNLTMGLKNDNIPLMRSAISSSRNMLNELENSKQKLKV
jgi:hypothetical protein